MHIKWFLVILFYQIHNTASTGAARDSRKNPGEKLENHLLPAHPCNLPCNFTLVDILTGHQVGKVRESGSSN